MSGAWSPLARAVNDGRTGGWTRTREPVWRTSPRQPRDSALPYGSACSGARFILTGGMTLAGPRPLLPGRVGPGSTLDDRSTFRPALRGAGRLARGSDRRRPG